MLFVTLAVVVAVIATQRARGVQWRSLEPGLEFTTIRGEPFCRRGSADIAVLRMDPRRFRIGVRHYSSETGGEPLGILEWRRRSQALAVFNAGQYYPDLQYMGLLVSDGSVISRRRHPEYQAALVSEPVSGPADARVLDLTVDRIDLREPQWREVAQSFMLFDRNGELRVRKTDRVANRTIVGEDASGRVLVVTTEGGYKLWELAQLLQASALGLNHAMCMDGGAEAKLCVRAGQFSYASFGPWNGDDRASAPGAGVLLPAVITVKRR
jgi:exopolysaccharide biosynthesis protein